jgi:hypothetical protein
MNIEFASPHISSIIQQLYIYNQDFCFWIFEQIFINLSEIDLYRVQWVCKKFKSLIDIFLCKLKYEKSCMKCIDNNLIFSFQRLDFSIIDWRTRMCIEKSIDTKNWRFLMFIVKKFINTNHIGIIFDLLCFYGINKMILFILIAFQDNSKKTELLYSGIKLALTGMHVPTIELLIEKGAFISDDQIYRYSFLFK